MVNNYYVNPMNIPQKREYWLDCPHCATFVQISVSLWPCRQVQQRHSQVGPHTRWRKLPGSVPHSDNADRSEWSRTEQLKINEIIGYFLLNYID